MGSDFELCVVDSDEATAKNHLQQGVIEIQRIEQLLTEFSNTSLTAKINANAGRTAIAISDELFQLLQRCIQISKLTLGYFDITVGPLKQLYHFKNTEFVLPSKDQIKTALQKVGYQHLILDPQKRTVFLKQAHMHISFAAIGKGYAADRVKQIWMANGITSGYINASGDLTAFGSHPKGHPWKIGISHPDNSQHTPLYLPLKNACVATSGDYEQYFKHNNIRYSHNINPKTGLPIKGIKSVTIISPSAELSDALATAIYAMGVEKGLDFIHQLPQTHAIIIDEKNNVSFSKFLDYEAIN